MPTTSAGGPYALPISRAYVKAHCRITHSAEDRLLDTWIRVATRDVEAATWRQLVTAAFDYRFDAFPCRAFRLPRAPLRKVESIKYLDDAGVEQTLASSVYRVVTQGEDEPGFIELAYGQSWPTTYPVSNAVTVRFTGGYATPLTADAASDVLAAAGHAYADGDLVHLSTNDADLPSPLQADVDYYARDVVAGVSLKLASSAGGAAIDIEDAGTGLNFLGEIPEPIIHAIALQVRHYNENREPVAVGVSLAEMPMSVQALLAPYDLSSRM